MEISKLVNNNNISNSMKTRTLHTHTKISDVLKFNFSLNKSFSRAHSLVLNGRLFRCVKASLEAAQFQLSTAA